MNRKNQDNKQIINEAADRLRPSLDQGIPDQELRDVASEFEVWPFEIVEALGASLSGGFFRVKTKIVEKADEQPLTACKVTFIDGPAPKSMARSTSPAPLEPAAPVEQNQTPGAKPEQAPVQQRSVTASSGSIWSQRLAFLAEAQGQEVSMTFEQMQADGWPSSTWKHPAFWGVTNPPGRAARAAGWTPKFRDGFGVVFTRTAGA